MLLAGLEVLMVKNCDRGLTCEVLQSDFFSGGKFRAKVWSFTTLKQIRSVVASSSLRPGPKAFTDKNNLLVIFLKV